MGKVHTAIQNLQTAALEQRLRSFPMRTRRGTTRLRRLLGLSPKAEDLGELKIHDRALRTLYRERLEQERAYVRVDSHIKQIGVQIPCHGPSMISTSLRIRK